MKITKTDLIFMGIILIFGIGLGFLIFQIPSKPVIPIFKPSPEILRKDSIIHQQQEMALQAIELGRRNEIIKSKEKIIKNITDKFNNLIAELPKYSKDEQVKQYNKFFDYGSVYKDSAIVSVNSCMNANKAMYSLLSCIEVRMEKDSIIQQLKENDSIHILMSNKKDSIIQMRTENEEELKQDLKECNEYGIKSNKENASLKKQRKWLIGTVFTETVIIVTSFLLRK